MKIISLGNSRGAVYTSNVYLLQGDWKAIADLNTLVDVGNDPAIIKEIQRVPKGLGKRRVEQVVLTHGHFDHAGLLPTIRELFDPVVYAYSATMEPDVLVEDGQVLRCGDQACEVIYTPGHSQDSICLYCERDGALFVGDTPVIVRSPIGTYEVGFIRALERICRKEVNAIYFGHGQPLLKNCNAQLRASLRNIR